MKTIETFPAPPEQLVGHRNMETGEIIEVGDCYFHWGYHVLIYLGYGGYSCELIGSRVPADSRFYRPHA